MNTSFNNENNFDNLRNGISNCIESDSDLLKQWKADSIAVNAASLKLVGANKWYASERLYHSQRKTAEF